MSNLLLNEWKYINIPRQQDVNVNVNVYVYWIL